MGCSTHTLSLTLLRLIRQGKGSPQLVVSPLNASAGNGVRLLAFEIPQSPVTSRWSATVLDSELNRMHNHWHVDFDTNNSIDTITASREGLSLIRRTESGWQRQQLWDANTCARLVARNRNRKKFKICFESVLDHS